MCFILNDLRLTILNENEFKGEYEIFPLHKGYGITIGNALRRVLLSSISGIAVTAVHLEGIYHQFVSIPNALEDGINLVANIKKLVFKGKLNERKTVTVNVHGKREVKASDLVCPGGIEIANKDLVLAHLVDNSAKFNLTLYIEEGVGFRFAEENRDSSYPIGVFPIDSDFSPIKHIAFDVKQAMFGESLNYENLVLTIETNSAIAPMDALRTATNILTEYFSNILVQKEIKEEIPEEKYIPEIPDILKRPLEEVVPLSVRTGNVFKKAGIYTVGDFFSKSKKELLSLKNFGIKSLSETIDELIKVLDIERLKIRADLPLIQEIINGEIITGEETEEGEAIPVVSPGETALKTEKEVLEENILNMPVEEMAMEIGIPQGQIEKLKKLQIETIEHLTHMKREDLLTGNYKLSKKYVDRIEDFLISHNLRYKE